MFEKIKELVADQFGVAPETITMETLFQEDLNADSLDIVELIMSIEEEFDITVEDEEVEGIVSIGDIVNNLKNKMN